MSRAYNAIDADGHVLEPTTLWDDYMDPAFRDRAPRLVVNNDGKEMLLIERRSPAASRAWAESAGSARARARSRLRR